VVAAQAVRVPVVHTFHALGSVKRRHQGDADTSPQARLAVERRLLREPSAVIATCTDEVRELQAMATVDAPVHVVPCGVDLDAFTATGAAERRSREIRVLSVSRLVRRKGVEDVLRALPLLPEAELVIAGGSGDGDVYVKELRSLARDLGIADRVDFRGPVDRRHLPALMRSASVGVCTPWYEPFGIVPIEMMACGVPVVASAVGGMLDTVVHGETGLHVEPRKPDAIAAAIRTITASSATQRRMRRAAAARSRAYGWPEIAWRTRAVYAELAQVRNVEVEMMEGVL
jgi:D-inositol-3-phosphate glycosyltransferase